MVAWRLTPGDAMPGLIVPFALLMTLACAPPAVSTSVVAPTAPAPAAPPAVAEFVDRALTIADIVGVWLSDTAPGDPGSLVFDDAGLYQSNYGPSMPPAQKWHLDGSRVVLDRSYGPTEARLRLDGALVDRRVYRRGDSPASIVGKWRVDDPLTSDWRRDERTFRADGTTTHEWWLGSGRTVDVGNATEHHVEEGRWALKPATESWLKGHQTLQVLVDKEVHDGVPSAVSGYTQPLDGSVAAAPAGVREENDYVFTSEGRLYTYQTWWVAVP